VTLSAIPEGGVLLHIGPQKTGSTAIQHAMHGRRADLAAHGVLYPGPNFRLLEAGWATLGAGAPVGRPAPRMSAWHRIVGLVERNELPRACLSTEDWARADDAAVDRIAGDLGPDRLHVLYVARRLDRLLPSHWQERVKARMTLSWHEFLALMLDERSSDWERWMMWAPQDVGAVVGRWARWVDPARITVVVADEHDRDLIPRTFEQLLALPAGFLDPPREARANRSFTYPEVEALRRVNAVFKELDLGPRAYWRIVQAGIAKRLGNSPRPPGQPPIPGLPGWALEQVAARCDAQADALRESGATVVGDPDALRIRDVVEPDDEPPAVDAIALDVFAEFVAGALTGAVDLQQREVADALREHRSVDETGGRDLARELLRRVRRRIRRG
jgi:hypothetical protein